MKSVNQVTILGNVTREPECKSVGNTMLAKLCIATSEGGYIKQDGTQVPEKTQFHNIDAWRGLATIVQKLIHKGDSVFVTGHIEYSEREEGGKKVRYTNIIAEDISLCHSRNGAQNQSFQGNQQPASKPAPAPMPRRETAIAQDGRPIYKGDDGQWYYADVMPQ